MHRIDTSTKEIRNASESLQKPFFEDSDTVARNDHVSFSSFYPMFGVFRTRQVCFLVNNRFGVYSINAYTHIYLGHDACLVINVNRMLHKW